MPKENNESFAGWEYPAMPEEAKARARTGLSTPLEDPLVKNGRKICLQTLDCLLATEASQKLLHDSMEERLVTDPLGFFEDFVMPNLPKQTLMEVRRDTKATLSIILTEEVVGQEDRSSINHPAIIDSPPPVPVLEAKLASTAQHSAHDETAKVKVEVTQIKATGVPQPVIP